MPVRDQKPSPEREETDENLRTERQKADNTVHERMAAEKEARRLLIAAREEADAVLLAARERADHPQGGDQGPMPRRSLVAQREDEDGMVEAARARVDEKLEEALQESQRALASLLPLEREATDRTLLTERVRSDDAVANRDEFLGIVSHDLRNLLGGIVVTASLLAKKAPENAEETKRIQRYAARMNRLIGDLVDVASIDAGKLSIVKVAHDAGAIVDEAVDLFRGPAAAKGISLLARHPDKPLAADFDHDRILQVLANLVTNAIKFGAKGDTVTVACEGGERGVSFSIDDEGPGIPGDMLEAIFERFCQVGKNDRRGVGLGLYIARCIVEAHGGKIHCESVVGEASTFRFSLPAVADAAS